MAIVEKAFFLATCDGCGDQFGDDETMAFRVFETREQAVDHITEEDDPGYYPGEVKDDGTVRCCRCMGERDQPPIQLGEPAEVIPIRRADSDESAVEAQAEQEPTSGALGDAQPGVARTEGGS